MEAEGWANEQERVDRRASKAHHRGDGRFHNPHCTRIYRRLHHLLLWQLGFFNDLFPPEEAPEDFIYPNPPQLLDPSQPTVTWINHSTFLITVGGVTLLTDPIWSKRCSPLTGFGPKRRHHPPVQIEELPGLDYVLISHNHYDHLDKRTVKEIAARFPHVSWCVPLGVAEWFYKQGIGRVIELDWWETFEPLKRGPKGPEVAIHAVPAQHYSGRGPLDHNRSLWAGWMAQVGDKNFYFVGDTGYNPVHFKEIGEEFGAVDLALIPIGVYTPRRFMAPVHMNPEDAVELHKDVNSKLSVGTHWRTFKLSSEAPFQPPYDLHKAMEKEGLCHSTFRVIHPGQSIHW